MLRARLDITDAVGTRTVPLDKDLFHIGRRSSHDLHLDGADVSRDHAEIQRTANGFILRDRGSRWGTFVNGEPIAERVLEHGDHIHIGRRSGADLVFLFDEAIASTPPSPAAAGDLRQIATLFEALRALGSGRVLDEVLALVLDSALEVTGAERGFIMLADTPARLEFKLGRGRRPRGAEGPGRYVTLPGQTFETSRKIPEEVFATGEARVVADLLDGDVDGGHVGTIALGIRHVLCVPLNLIRYVDAADAALESRASFGPAAKRIGVLYLDGRDRGTLLSDQTRTALETLAAEAALAIDNARLYRQAIEKARLEQQMKVGADIQQALLPKPHYIDEAVEIAGASSPCLAIGGDFFDYTSLPDGAFGFVVGDVSGKGLPAALLSAMVQGVFALETSVGELPAPVVSRLNAMLLRKAVEGRFATLFYAVLSREGRLTYTNAGHNAPIVIGTAGLRRLQRGGTIVGAFPEATFDQETVALDPDDLVVVFSDGVTEAFNAEWEEFGEQRLIDCVEANQRLAPLAVRDALMAAVKIFVKNAVQSDDITILVLRYRGRSVRPPGSS